MSLGDIAKAAWEERFGKADPLLQPAGPGWERHTVGGMDLAVRAETVLVSDGRLPACAKEWRPLDPLGVALVHEFLRWRAGMKESLISTKADLVIAEAKLADTKANLEGIRARLAARDLAEVRLNDE